MDDARQCDGWILARAESMTCYPMEFWLWFQDIKRKWLNYIGPCPGMLQGSSACTAGWIALTFQTYWIGRPPWEHQKHSSNNFSILLDALPLDLPSLIWKQNKALLLLAQADHLLMPMERIICSVGRLCFQFGKVANFPMCVESTVVAHTQLRNLINFTVHWILNHKMKTVL